MCMVAHVSLIEFIQPTFPIEHQRKLTRKLLPFHALRPITQTS